MLLLLAIKQDIPDKIVELLLLAIKQETILKM